MPGCSHPPCLFLSPEPVSTGTPSFPLSFLLMPTSPSAPCEASSGGEGGRKDGACVERGGAEDLHSVFR